MFSRNWATNKIIGIELGRQMTNWFHFKLQWEKPRHIYLYFKFLPIPLIRFHHETAGGLCGYKRWRYYGHYYLEGLAVRAWAFWLGIPRVEFEIITMFPLSKRVSKDYDN